ncbi:peptidoglycan endopeptidase [Streptomyces sp. SID13666]|nr:peptidoglycan endopeptidase [Streptomyces sp. SID13666]NEA71924.1 peptidoglycan endopeptidase [Streptomyces sp. SID13588]
MMRSLVTAVVLAAMACLLSLTTGVTTASAATACEVRGHQDDISEIAKSIVANACGVTDAGTWYTWTGGHGAKPGQTYGAIDWSDKDKSKFDPIRRGFDCSGLVRWALSEAYGYDIAGSPGLTNNIYGLYPPGSQRFGAEAGLDPLLPGDILFWGKPGAIHHVAIYLGAGKMVEAKESDTLLMVSDFRMGAKNDYAGALRMAPKANPPGGSPGGTGSIGHATWGDSLNVRAQPNTGSSVVRTIPGGTSVFISCQAHAQSITAEGTTNDAWSYLPDLGGWITNIYLKGPAWVPDVPSCGDVPSGGAGGGGSGAAHVTWGDSLNVRAQPNSGSTVVTTIPGGTSVVISCQAHAQSITAEGTTNDAWSYLPDLGGWITNIYLKGPAWMTGVPTCGGTGGSTGSGIAHVTWGDSLNIRSQPNTGASVVRTISGGTSVIISCQMHAQSLTLEGTTNDAWSYVPDLGGWITNIYLKGPAWVTGVPTCASV